MARWNDPEGPPEDVSDAERSEMFEQLAGTDLSDDPADRRQFVVPAAAFQSFVRALDKPHDSAPLRRLLKTEAPWER